MTIKDMSMNQWRPYMEQLQKLLRDNSVLRPSRITRVQDNTIALEGGRLPATYNADTMTLSVWSSAGRYSGGHMTAQEVSKVQEVCDDWVRQNKHFHEVEE